MIAAVADVEADLGPDAIDHGEGLPVISGAERDPPVTARQSGGQHGSQGRPAQGIPPRGAGDLESLPPPQLRRVQPGERIRLVIGMRPQVHMEDGGVTERPVGPPPGSAAGLGHITS